MADCSGWRVTHHGQLASTGDPEPPHELSSSSPENFRPTLIESSFSPGPVRSKGVGGLLVLRQARTW